MSNKPHSDKHHTEHTHHTTPIERNTEIPKPAPVHHHHHREAKKPLQLVLKPVYPRKMMVANIRQQRQNVRGSR